MFGKKVGPLAVWQWLVVIALFYMIKADAAGAGDTFVKAFHKVGHGFDNIGIFLSTFLKGVL